MLCPLFAHGGGEDREEIRLIARGSLDGVGQTSDRWPDGVISAFQIV